MFWSKFLVRRADTVDEIDLNSQSTKKYIINLLDNHMLCEYLEESYLNTVFNPNDLHLCNYFAEDEFIVCNRNTKSHLNILSMNIRSLPKHSGELKSFINICIVKWIWYHCSGGNLVTQYIHRWAPICRLCFPLCYAWCEFLWWCWYIWKRQNGKCVYIYIYLSITNHVIVFNVKQKVFLPDLFITLYQLLSVEFIGTPTKTPHFVKDLDRSLENISNDITAILTGDLNIDIIKVENEITLEYVSTLMSYGYLPYNTLPSRLTEYSAICIDHIFMKYARNSRLQPTNT